MIDWLTLKFYPLTLQAISCAGLCQEWKLKGLLAHSSGAVWESRWPSWAAHSEHRFPAPASWRKYVVNHCLEFASWAVRPNEPSGFRGRKAILNHALALVSACPKYVNRHPRTLSNTTYLPTAGGSGRGEHFRLGEECVCACVPAIVCVM